MLKKRVYNMITRLIFVWQAHLEFELTDLEFCPEDDRELFIHDTLGSLLLRSSDLLELQIPESNRHLLRSIVVLHRTLAI